MRTHIEVMHDILGVVKDRSGTIKPTHILFKSNLSYQMMDEYLKELIKKSFLTEQKFKKGRTYAIAPRGIQFLKQYELVKDFSSSFGLDRPMNSRI